MSDTQTASGLLSEKWVKRGIGLAAHVASWSSDPSTQVGAVIVDSTNRVLATGWNGFPRGVADTYERLNDRETKYKLVVHAEQNAVYNAAYTGTPLRDSTLFVYGLPVCPDCAKGVIQSGIKTVFMCYDVETNRAKGTKWLDAQLETTELFDEAGVEWHVVS